jgi:hypothetical protein
MIAFKTFSQLEESQRPSGVPLSWPCEEIVILNEQVSSFEILGYSVVTNEQYLAHKATHQAAFDAWLLAQQDAVSYWKIYDFVADKKKFNTTQSPIDLDFRSGLTVMLHRKSQVVKGECIKEEYYQNCSVDQVGNLTYTNLVVSEHHTFTRDSLGFPVYRASYLKYYDKNGVASEPVKTWVKFYSQLEKIQEGKTRRGNLVDNLQMPCIGLISIALTGSPIPSTSVILTGRAFLYDYKKEFDAFVDESNREIVACLQNPTNSKYASASKYPWINSMTPYGVTIRQFLIGELTI